MWVFAHHDLIGEFDKLRAGLSEGPENWMPGSFEADSEGVAELCAETPFGRLTRHAVIQTGPPELRKNEVIVPLNWRSLEDDDFFPIFYGELRLQRVAGSRSQLTLQGYYISPGGLVDHAAHAIVLNAVAKATVEDFAQRVAGILSLDALARSVDEQVTSKRLSLAEDR